MSKYAYKKKEAEAVEVPVPSGNVFLMEKPSKYSILFNFKSMPTSLTNKAVESWEQQGVGNEAVEEAVAGSSQEDRLKMMEMSFKVRDDVLRLSREPKIVMGAAKNDDELSVDDISDEDLDHLFKWVAAGGVAPQIASFPGRSTESTLAGASGKARRGKAVAVSGAE